MASRRERRQRRLERKPQGQAASRQQRDATPSEQVSSKAKGGLLYRIYHNHYKKLLFIPFFILLLALLQIGLQVAQTGDFLHKGVSLKGGLTLTVPINGEQVTPDQIQALLKKSYPSSDIIVRGISELGTLKGLTIEVESDAQEEEAIRTLEKGIIAQVATVVPSAPDDYSVEVIGPSLGAAFFNQTLKALLIALVLMGMVIFLYFGIGKWIKVIAVLLSIIASIIIFNVSGVFSVSVSIILGVALAVLYVRYSPPSAAVILAAISDIIMTLAVVNVLGIKISTAGIAAFLMLIGYSVDTDILLSTRVLKHKKGTVYDRAVSSFKTGATMTVTSMAAALVGYLVSQSTTIKEIMLIIFIGGIMDLINTWLQNAGIIRLYAERRKAELGE